MSEILKEVRLGPRLCQPWDGVRAVKQAIRENPNGSEQEITAAAWRKMRGMIDPRTPATFLRRWLRLRRKVST